MTQIGFLAHDLSDPSVLRRIKMLRAGGATVKTSGFLRGEGGTVNPEIEPALTLGRTHDAQLAKRALSVLQVMSTRMSALKDYFENIDVLIARNLEMLCIGAALIRQMDRQFGRRPRLVYECLDIHRLLTDPGVSGGLIRRVEALAGREVDVVVTSSPAFVENHLGKGIFSGRVALVENKVATFDMNRPAPPLRTFPGGPWRIGWFGNLRCRRSLEMLKELAKNANGEVEVILRGRPSEAIFPDLDAELRDCPNIHFEGPYNGDQALAQIYREVHFAWCIDYYEEDRNSRWLLPNRLYESAFHKTVPIALLHNETGQFLQRLRAGALFADVDADLLLGFFLSLDPDDYAARVARLDTVPRQTWSTDVDECRQLVRTLAGRLPVAELPDRFVRYGT